MSKKFIIKHIWFDLDGTLTIHNESYVNAYNNLAYKTLSEHKKLPIAKAMDLFVDRHNKIGSYSRTFESLGLGKHFWHDILGEWDDTVFYDLDDHSDIRTKVQTLSQKTPVSIFTNTSKSRLAKILKHLSYDPAIFQFLLSGDMVGKRKPETDGYKEILKLSRLQPEEILYVGDRVKADILPAKKLGLQTALLYSRSDEADFSFKDFTQFYDHIYKP